MDIHITHCQPKPETLRFLIDQSSKTQDYEAKIFNYKSTVGNHKYLIPIIQDLYIYLIPANRQLLIICWFRFRGTPYKATVNEDTPVGTTIFSAIEVDHHHEYKVYVH